MKDYDSLYTGKQIDDAIGAVYGFSKELAKKQNLLKGEQLDAVNSGVTADKVQKYDGYDARINLNYTEINTLMGKPGLDKVGTVTKVNNVSPDSSGNVSIDIPTVPTVNNGQLTIQKNGTTVATFTANQSGNATANITVPTKTSELTNDSFVTVETAQTISGNKTFRGDYTNLETNEIKIGKQVDDRRNIGDAPQTLSFMSYNRSTGGCYNSVIFSGVGDWLYCAHAKDNFDIRASYRGDGSENDTYDPNLGYTHKWLNNLTDWKYTDGWHVFASKITNATPAIIQIKFTTKLYTDVLRLILTGHGLKDRRGDYSGFLDDYTIEVCTDYKNDTWVTVVNRTNASDNIGMGLIYGLQLSTYTECYGIRLKITKCHVTGIGYQFINITSMQLRDYRPAFTVPDSVGAVSQLGGDVWGELKVHSNLTTGNILPMSNNSYALGTESSQYYKICAQDFYESGQKLINKYLGKTAQAADSAKLNGQSASYYLNYNNLTNKPSAVTSINGLTGGTVNGDITLTKQLVFTDNTNPYIKMSTGGNTYLFQSIGGQFSLGPAWDLATKWSADGSVQFPVRPKVGTTDVALKSEIPASVTETTVSGWGFTKNNGTVTGVKMNGTIKNPTSGVVDLGTVITAHQSLAGKQDKLSDTQMAAVNSGINSNKIMLYDGYDSRLNSLQGKPGLDKVGTVTSVAVKMNGSTKGTVTSSGTIDLGTVLTSHQSLSGYVKIVSNSNGVMTITY